MSCFTCAYKVLHQYSLNSTAYSELYTVYHFLLTLAITQVECERSFSKLKLIKTRLRSSLSQENLESLMLMSLETDILNRVSLDKVVDMLASTSTELKLCLRSTIFFIVLLYIRTNWDISKIKTKGEMIEYLNTRPLLKPH